MFHFWIHILWKVVYFHIPHIGVCILNTYFVCVCWRFVPQNGGENSRNNSEERSSSADTFVFLLKVFDLFGLESH